MSVHVRFSENLAHPELIPLHNLREVLGDAAPTPLPSNVTWQEAFKHGFDILKELVKGNADPGDVTSRKLEQLETGRRQLFELGERLTQEVQLPGPLDKAVAATAESFARAITSDDVGVRPSDRRAAPLYAHLAKSSADFAHAVTVDDADLRPGGNEAERRHTRLVESFAQQVTSSGDDDCRNPYLNNHESPMRHKFAWAEYP